MKHSCLPWPRGDQDVLATLNQRYGRALSAVADTNPARQGRRRRSRGGCIVAALARGVAIRSQSRLGWSVDYDDGAQPRDRSTARAQGSRAARRQCRRGHGHRRSIKRNSQRDRRRKVEIALATLNDGERDLLRLAYFSDLSQSEIAERTSIPLGTVKSRMRAGLIRLRDALRGSVE